MSLSIADATRLREAGFLQGEIEELSEAKDTSGKDQPPILLDSPVWQAVMKSRQEWWVDKVNRNWTEEDIQREIMGYYERDEKRSPWDFLKAEYRPPKKVDYIEARRKRAEAQVMELYKK